MGPGRGRVESDFALYEVTEGMNMPNHLGPDSFATLLVCLIMIAIVVVPFVRIFQKAGRTGWWAVLILIPIVNIIVLWIFAFSQWPALDRLKNSK
jgi:uncharacterized membrane protein YhaH (DUF805 family)